MSCSTSTPINHIVFFFLQNNSCIRKPQVISGGGGGGRTLHPPPRSAPVVPNCQIDFCAQNSLNRSRDN